MAGLILEGGTFRTVFTFGVFDALIEENLYFPYVIGVSAGAAYACSYVCKQKGRNIAILKKYRNDKRYVGIRNFFTDRSLFGLNFSYYRMVTELMPLDWEAYKKGTTRFDVTVTNALTGKPEYVPFDPNDKKCTALMATCAIPLLFPAIKLNNTPYYDGGLSDSIPLKKSIAEGNVKNLVVLTRPKGYVKENSRATKFAIRTLHHKYPELTRTMKNRPEMYNRQIAFCEKQESAGNAIILRPDYMLNSFEKDVDTLEKNYRHGYNKAKEMMSIIKTL